MKKYFLIMLSIAFGLSVQAGDGKTDLSPIYIKGGAHIKILPVHYDENGVIVRSDSMLYNVEVTVKDQRGAVMNRQHLDLLPKTDNVISAPDSPDSEKRTIEIIVDKQKYFGYFE